jgi:hypothetical protein
MSEIPKLKITKRIGLEFIPPLIFAVVWIFYLAGITPSSFEKLKNFSVAFFMASWAWAQVLRIIHQIRQNDNLSSIKNGLGAASTAVATLQKSVDVILSQRTPVQRSQLDELANLVSTANNQIATANNACATILMDNFILDAKATVGN